MLSAIPTCLPAVQAFGHFALSAKKEAAQYTSAVLKAPDCFVELSGQLHLVSHAHAFGVCAHSPPRKKQPSMLGYS